MQSRFCSETLFESPTRYRGTITGGIAVVWSKRHKILGMATFVRLDYQPLFGKGAHAHPRPAVSSLGGKSEPIPSSNMKLFLELQGGSIT